MPVYSQQDSQIIVIKIKIRCHSSHHNKQMAASIKLNKHQSHLNSLKSSPCLISYRYFPCSLFNKHIELLALSPNAFLHRGFIAVSSATCNCLRPHGPQPSVVMDQASLSMVFSRQEYWRGLSCPLPSSATAYSKYVHGFFLTVFRPFLRGHCIT